MARQKVEDPGSLSWSDPMIDESVEGYILEREVKDYKGNDRVYVTFLVTNNPSGAVEAVTFGCPTLLANRLRKVADRSFVEIIYKGEKKGQNGSSYKDFEVFTDPEEDGKLKEWVKKARAQQQAQATIRQTRERVLDDADADSIDALLG